MTDSQGAMPSAGPPRQPPTTGNFITQRGRVDVAIVIVTHQSAADIDDLLESLRPETAEQTVRVIVADNASTDQTLEHVRAHPDVIVVDTGGNLGYAGGINAALAASDEADALLILNPDVRVERHCIASLRRRMREARAGIVVPAILDRNGGLSRSLRHEPSVARALGDALFGSSWGRRPAFLTETVRAPSAYAFPHRIEWATGAALLISREVAEQVGPWDERFFLYSEETDYFRRVREAGYETWYEPSAKVTHSEGGSGRSPELVALTIVNAIRYAEKHDPRSAPARRAIMAVHELRRWRDPSHRIARTVLLNRGRWDQLPRAVRSQTPGAPDIDHVVVTRFNLPSEGAESLIRARDGWLQSRVELFERYTVPSVRSQTCSNFAWIIYFDTESPDWLIERLRPLVDEGVFVPLYREVVGWPDLLSDARHVTGASGDLLITTNLDNDDAIAVNFIERLQESAQLGVREAVFLAHGLIRSGDRVFLRTDRTNAFCSVCEPWEGAMTAWRDWHIMLGRHMSTRVARGAPGWLQVIHERNVSNRVRGRLVSPRQYAPLFPGQLDDVPAPSAGTLVTELLVHTPLREGREAVRAAVKALLLGLLGKDGLGRLRERLQGFRTP